MWLGAHDSVVKFFDHGTAHRKNGSHVIVRANENDRTDVASGPLTKKVAHIEQRTLAQS